MIDEFDNSIMIVDESGVREFNPETLEAQLARSFLAAGLHELSVAGDIVLAVDYALCRSERPRRRFTAGELNATVARILDDTGYPEVARHFRRENTTSSISIRPDVETLRPLIERYTGAGSERAVELACMVAADAAKLGIEQAVPALFIELARYRDRVCEENKPIVGANYAPLGKGEEMFILEGRRLRQALSGRAGTWCDHDLIRLLPVSKLFPCIRIFFRIGACAKLHQLERPVTELVLMPILYDAGMVLGEAVAQLRRAAGEDADLPFYLELPELRYFVEKFMGVDECGAEALCRTLADALSGCVPCEICRLRWN